MRPSVRTYPRRWRVQRMRRAGARPRATRAATSLSVSEGAAPPKGLITDRPRARDWMYSSAADRRVIADELATRGAVRLLDPVHARALFLHCLDTLLGKAQQRDVDRHGRLRGFKRYGEGLSRVTSSATLRAARQRRA